MTATSPATELLDAHVGQEIPGGCVHCSAVQAVQREADGIYRMTISHDDGCRTLHHHAKVLPLRVQLDELRRQWTWWRDLDVEQLARRDDLDWDELAPLARGDRVLAVSAWKAGRMAEIRFVGKALAAQLVEAEERATT